MLTALTALYDRHPFGIGMLGVWGGLSASAITFLQQLDLMIRIAGGVVALLVGLIVLILQGYKLSCLVKKWFGWGTALVLVCMLAGCSAVSTHAPSVSPAAVSILTAATSNARAIHSNAAARETLSVVRAQTSQLSATATAQQKPMVEQLSASLDAAAANLDSTQSDLESTSVALDKSTVQIGDLQKQLSDIADAKDAAEKAERTAKEHRDFWFGAAWKLALLSLGEGLWIFRKPLLALTGLPIGLPV